ncbi:2-hydroxyacid dehydrogenase [Herbaspirillum sp. BH-1]|uniref:Lactate dehydrogenase-like 2-hydroxyacid dehydrogenase n=1 Tax=Herbaspirillum frisingense TaxID=92645 RepID=A0ABU1PB12_9BURK|nr:MULTISPECIES: 2-hydroxyacid dehydrogenase [Herbaspirillum]MDR6583116.1 lactate dehydrogenase-like 2-hydroxyacid dehydrogenase [Herbaspirillum frisingense]PLY60033.1 2-hydroxyacid dehydrogenase [Herbaspirillum sp. BH-1]
MTSNERPTILIVARLPQHLLDLLQNNFTCHNLVLDQLSDDQLAVIAPQVRGIAANGEAKVGREFMARFPALEIVSVFGVGYDGVDVPAARERGIHVTHTPDVLTDDVADMAIALMLAVARNVVRADRFARSGEWKNGPFPFTTKVSGARLGIVGLGRIGEAIARRAAGFDMEIAYHNRSRKDVPYTYFGDIKSLAAAVDFLVMITPGGAGTRALVNADVLEALGPKGFLINVARGSVVDETALIAALKAGTIAGAGLDVFENEPNIPAELAAQENVVLTPHMASGTLVTRTAMADLAFNNLQAHFSGKPVITPVPD